MKLIKTFFATALVSLATISSAQAHGGNVGWSISIGSPYYAPPAYYSAPPVVYYGAPAVYYRPAPAVYSPYVNYYGWGGGGHRDWDRHEWRGEHRGWGRGEGRGHHGDRD